MNILTMDASQQYMTDDDISRKRTREEQEKEAEDKVCVHMLFYSETTLMIAFFRKIEETTDVVDVIYQRKAMFVPINLNLRDEKQPQRRVSCRIETIDTFK
jgi:hypothetical protein